MHIIVANNSLYTHVAGTSVFTLVSTPSGVTTHTLRPSFARYRKLTVVNGTFDPGVAWSETTSTFRKIGFTAPAAALTIAAGGGSGITASCRAYYIPVEKSGSTVIGRGNPGPVSNTVSLTNSGISYTGIPGTATDARTTHYEIYREDDGSIPRLDVTVTLGTTSATSTNTTTQLSLQTALPILTSGTTDLYARGRPPYCLYNETYHDRTWYAGDPNYPYRVWYSRTGEAEAVNTNDPGGTWIDTRDGEAVTGIKRCGDQLVVFCATCIYVIQGYSDGTDGSQADLTMVKVVPHFGCLSHHGIVNVGGRTGGDLLYFPSQAGVKSYNGAYFEDVMSDLGTYWLDAYEADKANYEDSFAGFDQKWNAYIIGIPAASTTFYYVGQIVDGKAQPVWTFDVKARREYSIGNLTTSTTSMLQSLHTGSGDGYVRQENQESVGPDDDVTKTSKVRWKHYYFGGISGGINHGHKFTNWDLYAKNESQPLSLRFFSGDELAGDATTPNKTITIAASASAGKIAKTAHYGLLDGCAGRGLTTEVTCTDGVDVQIKGFGVSFLPGVNTRRSSS